MTTPNNQGKQKHKSNISEDSVTFENWEKWFLDMRPNAQPQVTLNEHSIYIYHIPSLRKRFENPTFPYQQTSMNGCGFSSCGHINYSENVSPPGF